MLVSILLCLLGVLLLWGGAEALVRGASRLALRFGLSPLVVGLTVVAFGTSAPELMVSIGAALAGQGGIAIGNVVGSNIANVGLILGVCVIVRPLLVDPRMLRADLPAAIAATVLAAAFLVDGVLGRFEGVVLLGAFFVYIGLNLYDARKRPQTPMGAEALPVPQQPLAGSLLLVVGGVGVLALGAEALVRGATDVGQMLGVPSTIIGLSVVAIGTSLPEFAASLIAALRGQGDLALGNIVGSNIFNALGILGVAALLRPMHAPDLALGDLGAMLAAMMILLPLALSGRRLGRIEGLVLVVLYALYVVFLVAR